MRAAVLSLAFLAATALAGCRTEQTIVTPDPHLNRMLDQPKRLAYQNDPILPRGMAMQQPPDGTMPVDAPQGGPLVITGVANDHWAERIPVAVDRPLVEQGRRSFETYCAACHGALGDGESVVAQKMALRKPKNLVDDDAKSYPPGRIYQAVREGYGLMPSYSVQLDVTASWGVVAYVRALQHARGVRARDLPPDLRAQLEKEAP